MLKLSSFILPILLISSFCTSANELVSFYKDLKPSKLKKAKFYNPKPDPDDVIVSLPCDLKMAFRKVYTSTGTDKLQDNTFVAGNASDESLSQGIHLRHIQGGFKDDQGYYYLVAKYELLKFQVDAIRNNGICPKISPKNRIPITNISYFDAQDIARQMTLYIQGLGGTKSTLLQQDSFVRMLTDTEWEFAVRGGLNVTKEQFSESIPAFNGEELRDIAWYQGPQSSNGRVQLPGLKKPNPLKIYDMLGNVQEMVNDFFNPVNKQRMSGQVGGICVRGGSYLTPADRISSASRTERPLINPQNHKEAKSLDMGTRFTLASTAVFSDVDEVRDLNKEYSNEKDPASALASLSNFYQKQWFYIAIIAVLLALLAFVLFKKKKSPSLDKNSSDLNQDQSKVETNNSTIQSNSSFEAVNNITKEDQGSIQPQSSDIDKIEEPQELVAEPITTSKSFFEDTQKSAERSSDFNNEVSHIERISKTQYETSKVESQNIKSFRTEEIERSEPYESHYSYQEHSKRFDEYSPYREETVSEFSDNGSESLYKARKLFMRGGENNYNEALALYQRVPPHLMTQNDYDDIKTMKRTISILNGG